MERGKMKRIKSSAVLLLSGLFLCLFFQLNVNAQSNTIFVPDDYATIQEAINNAFYEDVILVKKGEYIGSIVVNKSITLVGEDKEETTILGDWSLNGTVVLVQSDEVVVKNLTMKAVYNSGPSGRGVHLLHVKNCQVTNCIFQCGIGVWLYGANNNIVKNNQISGADISLPSNAGIKLQQSTNNTINENTINGYIYGYGVFFDSSSNNDLIRNQIYNNYYEVLIKDSNKNNIKENNISTSISIFMNPSDQSMLESYGIRLQGSSDNTIIGNSVKCPKGIRILLSSSNNTVENNFISDCRYNGLEFVENANYNRVTANTIMNNGVGVNFWNSSNNLVYNNNFINNEVPISIYLINDSNSFDNGTNGNYWSNYYSTYPNATEIDDSGILNTPFYINEYNIDYYPLKQAVDVIPEFPSWMLLSLFLILTLVSLLIKKSFNHFY
jgi:nitrous oxidase accessory protein